MEHDLLIDEDGNIAFVHDDDLAALFEGELRQKTKRVSNVEPANQFCPVCRRRSDEHNSIDYVSACGVLASVFAPGWWMADMRISGGPVLGPFKTRSEALAAERSWLRRERGL